MKHDPAFTRRDFVRSAAGGGALAALAMTQGAFAQKLTRRQATRDDYSLDADLSYLNHGSIGVMPRAVQAAHIQYLQTCERFPSLYMWGDQWEALREQVRGKLSSFLHCSASELAITHNTTEGFNLLANGLPLTHGDEVLFSSLNHAGASRCFEHMASARGYSVRQFEAPLDLAPKLTASEVVDLHARQIRPNTKLLVIPHVDNLVGLRHPIALIAKAAREKGVKFIAVDGAQSAGMLEVRLDELNVDFYCGSPHKWLQTPKGLGFFFIRQELREQLRPMWVTWGQKKWAGTARVFEDYGTRNLPEVLAMGDAIDFHTQTPWRQRIAHYQNLRHYAQTLTVKRGFTWASPTSWEMGASLYSFFLPGVEGDSLERELIAQKIAVRVFSLPDGARVRISPNLVNTIADMDRLFEAL